MKRSLMLALSCALALAGCSDPEPTSSGGDPYDELAERLADDTDLQDAVSGALLGSPTFTERLIGQLLLDPGFVAALKGDPGADASPEDVARELLADEDFKGELVDQLLEDETLTAAVAQYLVDNHLEDIQGPPGAGAGASGRRLVFRVVNSQATVRGGPALVPDVSIPFEKRADDSLLRIEWQDHFVATTRCEYRIAINGSTEPCEVGHFVIGDLENPRQEAGFVTGYCELPAGQHTLGIQVSGSNPQGECRLLISFGVRGMIAVEEIAISP